MVDDDPALGDFPERAPGTRRWCFADQLGPHFLDDPHQEVLLVESRAVFRRRRFHRQKAHLVLSALRHRAAELGDRARFLQTDTYAEALDAVDEPLSVCAPTTWAARDFVLAREGVQVLASRGFVTDEQTFRRWATGRAPTGASGCSWTTSTGRAAAPRRPHGRRRTGGREVQLRPRQPRTPAGRRPVARAGAVDPDRGRDRRGGARRPRPLGARRRRAVRGRRRPPLFRPPVARPSTACATSWRTGWRPSARTRTPCSPTSRGWRTRCCRPR